MERGIGGLQSTQGETEQKGGELSKKEVLPTPGGVAREKGKSANKVERPDQGKKMEVAGKPSML